MSWLYITSKTKRLDIVPVMKTRRVILVIMKIMKKKWDSALKHPYKPVQLTGKYISFHL